jgi:hypothetical protein
MKFRFQKYQLKTKKKSHNGGVKYADQEDNHAGKISVKTRD